MNFFAALVYPVIKFGLDYKLYIGFAAPSPGRADRHRKSRSYCRTERPNRRKPLLGSQLSLNTRSKSAVPAQPGAPDGTHPPCGVRTFPPFRQLKCISDGKGKRGRKGWKTVGCPSLAFRSPSKGSFQSSQLHGKYSDSGCGASRKKKTVPDGDGFHERALRAEYCASADALKINLG